MRPKLKTSKKLTRKQIKALEQESKLTMKELIKHPKRLLKTDYKIGNIILYHYNAKYNKNPYDKTPLALILGRTRRYTYAINWNWIPRQLRKGLMTMILSKKNLKNIEKNRDIEVPKRLVRQIFRMGLPAFRMYLNNRISLNGVPIPHSLYPKIINLRAENFMNISAEEAWAIAVHKIRKNKRKRR